MEVLHPVGNYNGHFQGENIQSKLSQTSVDDYFNETRKKRLPGHDAILIPTCAWHAIFFMPRPTDTAGHVYQGL